MCRGFFIFTQKTYMVTLKTFGNAVLVNGSYLVNRGDIYATLSGGKLAVSVKGLPALNNIHGDYSDFTIDDLVPGNMEELLTWMGEKVFLNGGGDGQGSQSNSDTYTGTTPLYREELDELYPNAGPRFLVVAPNVGSGMLYVKIEMEPEGMWYSWAASAAIRNNN